MPLYVTNGKLQLGEPGKLAAQRACCCDEEGDNPEDCLCPHVCLYRIEVLSPLAFGPRPIVPCTEESNNSLIDQTPLDLGPCNAHWTNEGVSVFAGRVLNFLYAVASYRGQNLVSPGASASVNISCYGEKLLANIGWDLSVPGSVFLNYFGNPYRRMFRTATVELPSECFRKSNATCETGIYGPDVRGNFLSTPIEFTVSYDSPGIGAWDAAPFEEQSGDQANVTDCFEYLRENFSVTFRITQRQSCRIVDCGCSVDISGLKATFQGVELTIGTSYDQTFPEDGYDRRITHDFGFGVYRFTQYEILPGNLFRDELNIELFCDTDEDAEPPVSRWYARFISRCRVIDELTNVTSETTKTEIGYFLCGESAGCDGRATGDPIPLGEATEIEEEPGSPVTTDGLDACEPPTRASLSLSEDCG